MFSGRILLTAKMHSPILEAIQRWLDDATIKKLVAITAHVLVCALTILGCSAYTPDGTYTLSNGSVTVIEVTGIKSVVTIAG